MRDSSTFGLICANCEDVRIDNIKGIGMWRYNSDGIDLFNCKDAIIKNCFSIDFLLNLINIIAVITTATIRPATNTIYPLLLKELFFPNSFNVYTNINNANVIYPTIKAIFL